VVESKAADQVHFVSPKKPQPVEGFGHRLGEELRHEGRIPQRSLGRGSVSRIDSVNVVGFSVGLVGGGGFDGPIPPQHCFHA